MSANLWKYFYEDDVDSFRQYLADATLSAAATKSSAGIFSTPSKIAGSPGTLSTSPRTPLKSRKSSGYPPHASNSSRVAGHVLSRSDVNAKDSCGRTLLHHAASSRNPRALEFVVALLDVAFIDLYIQDAESGWTALHRALYFGNTAVAQALMLRDIKDATDYTTTASHSHAGGLIKIKDNEGNSPFEVFALTIAPRSIQMTDDHATIEAGEDEATYSMEVYDEDVVRDIHAKPSIDLRGDEVFAFGSNKNYSLGLGDQDDRQYPERIQVKRPAHLLHRLHEDLNLSRHRALAAQDLSMSQSFEASQNVPALIQYRPIAYQDVVMSKMHTAVLTDDPVSNLHMCGFGPSGRLGLGDESTRFAFTCLEGGGLSSRKITAVALGQDHSIAISSKGEVFTWGANQHGQLGYELPEVSVQETPVQLVPRQLFGNIKKEAVMGAAASSLHSALFTSSALFTFGRNEGQLGLMDADARSLEIQVVPRRVGVSVIKASIKMVTAIDRATSVLLENHDVIVFTHFGWTKVLFPVQGFTNYFISNTVSNLRSEDRLNSIRKITSSGNSICALSTFGEVFTVDVPKTPDSISNNASTTNPTKARNALPLPVRVWSIKKAHTAATDVAVGQDGSIVLCTAAGSVWRKEKRAKIKSINSREAGKTKEYKFVRVPNLTRAVAIRSNASGAYFAVRRDCDITRDQIVVDPPLLWGHLLKLLAFRDFRTLPTADAPRFWTSTITENSPAFIKHAILTASMNMRENSLTSFFGNHKAVGESTCDMYITSSETEVEIPIHTFMLKARSCIMRQALAAFETTYYFSIPHILSVEYGSDGQVTAQFQGADLLTILNLVFYLYTDNVIDVWHYASKTPRLASRYRQVRTDLMKIATALQMPQLERAARVMVDPTSTLHLNFETAICDADFFQDADLLIELADDAEMPAHSVLLCARCPFFEGMFNGRASGQWMAHRRDIAERRSEVIPVDLKHMDAQVFQLVLRHIYADTCDELFDQVCTRDQEEFIDLLIDVMSAANELMLDRLAEICQTHLGKYVTPRNVCQLLNIVADCSVNEFKHAALEYICLNLETMLEYRLLEELDEDLLAELDEVVQQNQHAYHPFARSCRAEADLQERYPELLYQIEEAWQRRVDSMRLRSRLNAENEERPTSTGKFKVGSWDGSASSPSTPMPGPSPRISPRPSPAMVPVDASPDLLFEMEEEQGLSQQTGNLSSTPFQEIPQGTSVRSDQARLDAEPSTPAARRTISADRAGKPWNQPSQGQTRVNFRDILSEAKETTSTSGLSSSNLSIPVGSPISQRGQTRVSQKERKKMQKEQLQSTSSDGHRKATLDATSTPQPAAPITSPWKRIEPRRTNSAQEEASLLTTRRAALAPRQQLPTRGSSDAVQSVKTGHFPKLDQSKEGRSSSSPITPPSGKPVASTIQSIRHTPMITSSRTSVDARTSMAEILSQQQTEKTAIKEAVAKRSLQEIQEEQEFQEWWDAESRRVQEEDAQSSTPRGRKAGSGRGRGDGRRNRGRGGSSTSTTSRDTSQTQLAAQEAVRKGRGGRRGRGE